MEEWKIDERQKFQNIEKELSDLENFINSQCRELNQPDLEKLFKGISDTHSKFLEMTILQRQLEIISKEEKNIIEFIDKECANIDNEILRLKSLSKNQNNEGKINELLKKLEIISNKKKARLLEINEWKKEVEENLESAGFQEFCRVKINPLGNNLKYFQILI